MEKKENIVTNDSKAYGYNYASLSDIAKQGFKIPKMKTGTENDKEYVYYYDDELKEWIRGAEVVIPDMRGSNQAQRYGSAITYARRYTCHLALQLACDDDKKVETQQPSEIFDEPTPASNLKALANRFRQLYSVEEQARILNGLKLKKAEEIGIVDLQKYINFKEYAKTQADNSKGNQPTN